MRRTKMSLKEMRIEIDKINDDIISAIEKRMKIVKNVAKYKKENSIPIVNESREESVLAFFENAFENRNMSRDAGRIIGRALIDAAIIEENRIHSSPILTKMESERRVSTV